MVIFHLEGRSGDMGRVMQLEQGSDLHVRGEEDGGEMGLMGLVNQGEMVLSGFD